MYMIFNILYESCPKIRDINFLGLELSPYPYLFSRYFRILYRTRQKLTALELKTCRRIYIYIYISLVPLLHINLHIFLYKGQTERV
jgi:hypothetical protein